MSRKDWLCRACKVGWRTALPLALAPALLLAQRNPGDLTQLDIEELGKIQVTSVSKKEQRLSDTAAAVYVITAEDIHHSAATSIPELLRMVPGLDVAQINGSRWAISARGFAEQYTNDMLVLVDGRNAFDPLFSGVMWDRLTLPLEDIERIEVIRGPGATMWGTNAFHGVINIITKSARQTQGALITSEAGNLEHIGGLAEYGGVLGKRAHYRAYAKYFDRGPAGDLIAGQPAHDSWRSLGGGFRLDATVSRRDSFTLEGNVLSSVTGLDDTYFSYTPPYRVAYADQMNGQNADLMARWEHKSESGAASTLQLAYGRAMNPQTVVDVNGNVLDASLQHQRTVGRRHEIVAGAEWRYTAARTSTADSVWYTPWNPHYTVSSGFLQDEILFRDGAVHLTAGLKAEYDSLSGFAPQPTVRVLWKVTARHSLWAAYSLANRGATPSDTSLTVNLAAFPGPFGLVVLRRLPNPAIGPERLHALEGGYRVQLHRKFFADVALFYNRYTDLIGTQPGQPFFEPGPPPRLVLPQVLQNDVRGFGVGGEFTARWMPTSALRFAASYSFIGLDLHTGTALAGAAEQSPALEAQTPRHQARLQSSVYFRHNLELNTWLSFVDRRMYQLVPGFVQVDSSLAWRPLERAEFSLGVRNLFNKEHVEFYSAQGTASTILTRSFYGKVAWHF